MAWALRPSQVLDLDQLVQLIERRFGYATPKQQYDVLVQTVDSILESHAYGISEFVHLLSTLPVDAPMVQSLLRELTNNETYFFRDQPTVDSLVNSVLPELVERRKNQRVLRIWSAGCSTGEELYTISILLHERIPDFDSWTIELIGTDIDEAVLQKARIAEYGDRALRATTEAARQRYFDREGKGYRLRQKFRQGARFEVHNLVDPNQPPPAGGRFDLIFCRNVTIYFLASGLEKIAQNLAGALSEDGIWVAAPSDPKPPVCFNTRVLPGMLVNTLLSETVANDVPEPARPPRNTLPATPSSKRGPTLVRELPKATQAPKRNATHSAPLAKPARAAAGGNARAQDVSDIELAMRLANEGQMQSALDAIRAVGRENPLLTEPYMVEASLLESIGEFDGALAALRRVLYLDPNRAEAHVRVALLLQRRGENQAAIRALRNAAVAGADANANETDREFRAFAARHLMRLLDGGSVE